MIASDLERITVACFSSGRVPRSHAPVPRRVHAGPATRLAAHELRRHRPSGVRRVPRPRRHGHQRDRRVGAVDRRHGDALPAGAQPRPPALDARPGRAALGAAVGSATSPECGSASSAWARSAARSRGWQQRSRWRSSACDADPAATSRAPRGAPTRLPDLLAWADAIVVTAPLTDDTRGMFDAEAFAAMRPGAWFVNVGRGEVVDEPAFVDALGTWTSRRRRSRRVRRPSRSRTTARSGRCRT